MASRGEVQSIPHSLWRFCYVATIIVRFSKKFNIMHMKKKDIMVMIHDLRICSQFSQLIA